MDRSPIVLIMGVTGAGKTSVASTLGARLGWSVLEGDDLHPPSNVARMRAGLPLDDADREPWLSAIAAWIETRSRSATPGIVTCSALRRSYRDRLRGSLGDVWFVHLEVPRETLRRRVDTRQHPYMPASLLDSQLALLEPLGPDERGLTISADRPVADVVSEVAAALAHLPLSRTPGAHREGGPHPPR